MNVTEYSKGTIAEFMGGVYDNTYNPEFPHYRIDDCSFYPEELKYDTSWDWLIPVWYKFRDLKFNSQNIHYDSINRSYVLYCENIRKYIPDYGIKNSFEIITEAIIWYNSIKDKI